MMAQPGEKFQPTRRSSRLHTSLDTGTPPSLNIESQTQSLTEIQSDVENKVKASQDTIVNVVEEDSGHAKGDGSASVVEKSLFVEIELPDGRIARQCRASMDCPKRSAFITKRLRMMKHLKDCHGLEIEIKKRAGGRPLHKEAERRANEMPNPDIKGWKKAAMKRFADKDWKFKQNCQKYQRLMRIRALQLWTDIGEDYKNKSQAAFIEDFVAGKMKEYMATKSIRLAKIQKRIDEGYDTHKRVHDAPPWLEAALEDNESEDPFLYAPSDEEEENSMDKKEVPPSATMTLHSHARDEVLLHTTSSKAKLPIRRFKTTKEPIEIGSPGDALALSINFYVSTNNQVRVEKSSEEDCSSIPSRNYRALQRLSAYVPMSIVSHRLGLQVDIDNHILRDILEGEASTRTMNLFAMWLDHMLADDLIHKFMFVDSMWVSVTEAALKGMDYMQTLCNFFGEKDFGHCSLLFFPIVFRNHWTCVVATISEIPEISSKKNQLLYYDPLGCMQFVDIAPILHSAMEALAHGIKDLPLKHAMQEPMSGFEVKVLKGPTQPNSVDCGFYVMAAIRYIIESCLKVNSKSWVTKKWFSHDDVLRLKENLHSWCFDIVGEE